MGVSWNRLGIALLVLAVAFPLATVAQRGGEGGPIPERDTTCWPCHVAWAPPLKTFYNMLPPPQAGAAVGEPFDFVVQLQNVWTPPGDGPYIHYFEPALDLSSAPSLDFFSDTEPKHEELAGTVAMNPTEPVSRGPPHVTEIPSGATTLTIQLVPNDASETTGPDLTLNLYPGMTTPEGAPAASVDAAGRGGTETFSLEGLAAFSGFGYGNWTIEAVATFAESASPLGIGTQGFAAPYTVIVDAAVESTGERVQIIPTRETVAKGGSTLFRYQLKANAAPAAGEVVRLAVNATVFYEHDDAGTDNYANVTKAYPRDIPVSFDGNAVTLTAEVDPDLVTGAFVQNGATMDTVSEAIGYATAFLLISSVWTGGMFGKASRRSLNTVFGSAKRRVAFHNFLSYGLMLAAAVHTVLFIIEAAYYWTLGLIWGGIALIAMTFLGVTGAWQVQMIRKWNYNTWRWSHYGLAVAAILFTLVHMALDGVHFGFIQEAIGWDDPLDPRAVG